MGSYSQYKRKEQDIKQVSGTYGSRATCGSFGGGIWLASYFLDTIVTDEIFSVIFIQSYQQHHTAPDVALTVRTGADLPLG